MDLELEVDDGVAVVTVNRPQARNAISRATMAEFEQVLDKIAGLVAGGDARALVITGAGERAFVSGGDLKELAAIRTEEGAVEMALRMRRICDRIAAFPGPVLAALNGHALGGGAEVAVAADIRVACEDVKIGFNQVTLAIMPAWGGLERLAGIVGPGRALLLAGTGRVLEAPEAERFGLLDVLLPREGFEAGWRLLARRLATGAAREIKRVAAGVHEEDAARSFARLWVAEDHWTAAEKVMSRGR